MSPPAWAFAFAAGIAAVAATWDALAELDAARVRVWVGRAAEPVRQAGTEGRALTAPERRRAGALVTVVLAAIAWLLGGLVAAGVAGVTGPALAAAAVRGRRRAFRERVRAGAAPAARALADALSGGASVRGAVVSAAAGLGGPPGVVLREAARALALGEPTETALERLRERARSPAWDTLVAATLLQREAGGDLAGLLRDLAASLEAAERVEREARVATAQARFTAGLVALLPAGGLVFAELADPGFAGRALAHPVSVWLAAAAGVLQVAAVVSVRRLAR